MTIAAKQGSQAAVLSWPEPDIALITMIRDKELNTLSLELLEELDLCLTISLLRGARCLIITGEGRAFCAGAHINYFLGTEPRVGSGGFALRDNYLKRIMDVFDRIEALPIPVIAAINGYALGGGCEMSLACDLRVMAEDAKIGLPETRIGALPAAGGVQKLHRLVGRSKAIEWILLGTHVSAADALAHGLVMSVHPAADLVQASIDIAKRLRLSGPRAMEQSKLAVNMCSDADLSTARKIGLEALAMLVDGAEWREGISAFLERREPRFQSVAREADDRTGRII